jgi:hypothetical protein
MQRPRTVRAAPTPSGRDDERALICPAMATIPFKPKRLVGVLRHNQHFLAIPTFFIEQDDANGYIAQGSAWRRSKYLIVLTEPKPLALRGPSAMIRENTVIKAAGGDTYHRILCASWRSRMPVVRMSWPKGDDGPVSVNA